MSSEPLGSRWVGAGHGRARPLSVRGLVLGAALCTVVFAAFFAIGRLTVPRASERPAPPTSTPVALTGSAIPARLSAAPSSHSAALAPPAEHTARTANGAPAASVAAAQNGAAAPSPAPVSAPAPAAAPAPSRAVTPPTAPTRGAPKSGSSPSIRPIPGAGSAPSTGSTPRAGAAPSPGAAQGVTGGAPAHTPRVVVKAPATPVAPPVEVKTGKGTSGSFDSSG